MSDNVVLTECIQCYKLVEWPEDCLNPLCSECMQDMNLSPEYKKKLTRYDRLQLAADAGYDTWDDYNGVK